MDKIICVGKNYLEHAQEMAAKSGDAIPEMPVLFLKPESVSVQVANMGETIEVKLPEGRGSTHHECEIVVRLNSQQKVEAVTLGLDLTLRDLQADLKKKGQPWEISKVFAGSAIVGPWISIADFTDYLEQEFTFSINGEVRQRGKGSAMRLSPEECVTYANGYFPVVEHDLVFTGTPAGVGPLAVGDVSELSWNFKSLFRVKWI